MTKMVMTVELEYDEVVMYGNDERSKKCFFDDVLADPYLILRSDFIGDEIGKVRVIDADVSHYAEEAKKLQEHNAALAASLQEFLYRVSGVVPFNGDKWLRDLGEEILKQLKEGPK